MNYMRNVAESLCVEMDSPFYIYDSRTGRTYPDKCCLSDEGILISEPVKFYQTDEDAPKILQALLTGVFKVCPINRYNWVPGGSTIYTLEDDTYNAEDDRGLEWYEFISKNERDIWRRYFSIKRRLRETAAELNSSAIDWGDTDQPKFYICACFRDYNDFKLDIRCEDTVCEEHTYFDTMTAAKKAIEIVGEEDLIWMMRDFQSEIEYSKPDCSAW